jgi:hypothetical protein
MLVHSYIYYSLGDSIVTDDTWQAWANELRDLQAVHGWRIDWYDTAFQDWDGATGCHLPRDSWVINKVRQLLRHRGEYR